MTRREHRPIDYDPTLDRRLPPPALPCLPLAGAILLLGLIIAVICWGISSLVAQSNAVTPTAPVSFEDFVVLITNTPSPTPSPSATETIDPLLLITPSPTNTPDYCYFLTPSATPTLTPFPLPRTPTGPEMLMTATAWAIAQTPTATPTDAPPWAWCNLYIQTLTVTPPTATPQRVIIDYRATTEWLATAVEGTRQSLILMYTPTPEPTPRSSAPRAQNAQVRMVQALMQQAQAQSIQPNSPPRPETVNLCQGPIIGVEGDCFSITNFQPQNSVLPTLIPTQTPLPTETPPE